MYFYICFNMFFWRKYFLGSKMYLFPWQNYGLLVNYGMLLIFSIINRILCLLICKYGLIVFLYLYNIILQLTYDACAHVSCFLTKHTPNIIFWSSFKYKLGFNYSFFNLLRRFEFTLPTFLLNIFNYLLSTHFKMWWLMIMCVCFQHQQVVG